MTAQEEYLGRVQATVWVPAEHVAADAIARVQHLVDHGEPAEGMCSLAWVIVNEGRKVPRSLIQDIRHLAAGLVDEEHMPAQLNDSATGS